MRAVVENRISRAKDGKPAKEYDCLSIYVKGLDGTDYRFALFFRNTLEKQLIMKDLGQSEVKQIR